jgi:hypothetical protein
VREKFITFARVNFLRIRYWPKLQFHVPQPCQKGSARRKGDARDRWQFSCSSVYLGDRLRFMGWPICLVPRSVLLIRYKWLVVPPVPSASLVTDRRELFPVLWDSNVIWVVLVAGGERRGGCGRQQGEQGDINTEGTTVFLGKESMLVFRGSCPSLTAVIILI